MSNSETPGSGSGVLQPVGKKRLGRQAPTSSANLYHPSKSQLIDWVNQTLLLGITRLEEFASGAVFCQMMDAYFAEIIPIHRVNFHAREEYEFVPNYKLLQSAFLEVKINRNIDVQKLMHGSPAECLELLQFLHKFLKKKKIIPGYDPYERRLRSVKGGTDRIPMPYWMHPHFDIYGRPEWSKHDFEHSYDGYIEAGRRSRTSRTPGPSGSYSSRSSKQRPHTRTASVDSRNYATELSAAMPEMQGSNRTLQDSTELQISHHRSRTTIPINSSRSPRHTVGFSPRLRPGRRTTPPPSPKKKPNGEAESSMQSVNLRSVENASTSDIPQPTTPTASAPEVVAEEGLLAVNRVHDALQDAVPSFKELLGDLGTENDNYAYRGKLRSMKDVINTLIRHNKLLIDKLETIYEQSPDQWHHAFRGFVDCVQHIRKLETEFQTCMHKLTQLETQNPIPCSCSLSMTEKQKQLSDMHAIDSVLRKIGAAQAAMNLPVTVTQEATFQFQTQGGVDSVNNGTVPDSKRLPKKEDRIAFNSREDLPSVTPAELKQGEDDYQIRHLHNGDTYKGRYRGSKKNGVGVYQFVNGDIYEGEFVNDRMCGHGVYTFANEGHYEGQWAESGYEGAGNETFARGSKYHGEYTKGMRNGWGTCRYYNGDYYEGQWKDGLREGRGMQQCTEESNYVGDYRAGKRHGYGLYCFPNNDRYIGEYESDIPHGYGIYEFSTGQKYEGQWKEGKKHGWCIYTIETGEKWAGEWDEGKPKWVQGLAHNEEHDPRWPQEIVERVEKAWMACRRARESSREGSVRAEEHWKPDGDIQNAIKAAKIRADTAVSKAQEARKKALHIASMLDKLAAEKEMTVQVEDQ